MTRLKTVLIIFRLDSIPIVKRKIDDLDRRFSFELKGSDRLKFNLIVKVSDLIGTGDNSNPRQISDFRAFSDEKGGRNKPFLRKVRDPKMQDFCKNQQFPDIHSARKEKAFKTSTTTRAKSQLDPLWLYFH